jgi:aminopeptidase N
MKNYIYILIVLGLAMASPSCGKSIKVMLEPGVSSELATYRKKYISNVSYELAFRIPEQLCDPISGNAIINFHQSRAQRGVILDFQGGADRIHRVTVNGQEENFQYLNEHIILSSRFIIPAMNRVEVDFTATDQAMNRSEEFMYTLFVPDRASTAFPCFDQPDLKAKFFLNLEIPESWTAVGNGPLLNVKTEKNRKHMTFSADHPISTYLFAFAAGNFDTIMHTIEDRSFTLYHRETDHEKLANNADRIFQQHFDALNWLEIYTGIPYPFAKLDMVLLPGFQYSGMEHPGAIWYRDNRLLLDKRAPISDQLAKASLIAHETAHMWFGNLVTMQWFDDVWLKEVFAGFMADKIVHPQFPDINHNLQFILSHFPRAYDIDRSRGTHPIKQHLDNLKKAGSLYGAIIYNKAPIVFQNLERMMGPDAFQQSVQEYLKKFSFNNSDWDDLAFIFDNNSSTDIMEWSHQWIYSTGMPDPYVPDSDVESRRAASHLKRYEGFLNNQERASSYFEHLVSSIEKENNAQIMRYLTNNLQRVFWRFLTHEERLHYASISENMLWKKINTVEPDEKPLFLEVFAKIALTEQAMNQLKEMYLNRISFKEMELSEEHRFLIASELMLREYPDSEQMLHDLMLSVTNPDRKRRMAFLQPVLSNEPIERDKFFSQLKDEENRRPEPWVVEGLNFLHHPLRSEQSRKYVGVSLDMLEEIQRTGDIFLPLHWLNATLGGYSDKATAKIVEEYLETHPDLNHDLQLKVWQAADHLFRAAPKR